MSIYVPQNDAGERSVPEVVRGSGIVSNGVMDTPQGKRVVVYFEGNLYGASNIVTWADRVRIAAGRCRERYPTVAIRQVDPAGLLRVGTISRDLNRMEVDNPAAVARWLGVDERAVVPELAFS